MRLSSVLRESLHDVSGCAVAMTRNRPAKISKTNGPQPRRATFIRHSPFYDRSFSNLISGRNNAIVVVPTKLTTIITATGATMELTICEPTRHCAA